MFTLPPDIPMSDITGDSHANDPNGPGYSSTAPTWIGQDFTFGGGTGTDLIIEDDDDSFDDGYVEEGGAQTLASAVTINGVTYPAGSVVENEFSLLDSLGNEVYVLRINGENIGFVYPVGNEPGNGETFTASSGRDGDPVDSGDAQSSSTSYSTMDSRSGKVDGTAGADLIDETYAGDPEGDRINQSGFNDVVYAGDGNDSVYSGQGDDTIYGGAGSDFIDAGIGNDSVDGGFGNDTIYAGDGNDTVDGGAGADSIYGGEGSDSLRGGDGERGATGTMAMPAWTISSPMTALAPTQSMAAAVRPTMTS
jgi:Ca2+-binding RTX toxin-like protein